MYLHQHQPQQGAMNMAPSPPMAPRAPQPQGGEGVAPRLHHPLHARPPAPPRQRCRFEVLKATQCLEDKDGSITAGTPIHDSKGARPPPQLLLQGRRPCPPPAPPRPSTAASQQDQIIHREYSTNASPDGWKSLQRAPPYEVPPYARQLEILCTSEEGRGSPGGSRMELFVSHQDSFYYVLWIPFLIKFYEVLVFTFWNSRSSKLIATFLQYLLPVPSGAKRPPVTPQTRRKGRRCWWAPLASC